MDTVVETVGALCETHGSLSVIGSCAYVDD